MNVKLNTLPNAMIHLVARSLSNYNTARLKKTSHKFHDIPLYLPQRKNFYLPLRNKITEWDEEYGYNGYGSEGIDHNGRRFLIVKNPKTKERRQVYNEERKRILKERKRQRMRKEERRAYNLLPANKVPMEKNGSYFNKTTGKPYSQSLYSKLYSKNKIPKARRYPFGKN